VKNNDINSSNELYKICKRNKNDSVNLENQMKEPSIFKYFYPKFKYQMERYDKRWY